MDFVSPRALIAIEVKSAHSGNVQQGLVEFAEAFQPIRSLLVGGDGIPVGEFLGRPIEHWMGG